MSGVLNVAGGLARVQHIAGLVALPDAEKTWRVRVQLHVIAALSEVQVAYRVVPPTDRDRRAGLLFAKPVIARGCLALQYTLRDRLAAFEDGGHHWAVHQ